MKSIFEYINKKPIRYRVEAYILNKENNLILGYVEKPNFKGYIIPGGGVDPGENNIEALKREVKEEIGVSISNPKLINNTFIKYQIKNSSSSSKAQEYISQYSGIELSSYVCNYNSDFKRRELVEYSVKEVTPQDAIAFFKEHAQNCATRGDKYNFEKAIYSIKCIMKAIKKIKI